MLQSQLCCGFHNSLPSTVQPIPQHCGCWLGSHHCFVTSLDGTALHWRCRGWIAPWNGHNSCCHKGASIFPSLRLQVQDHLSCLGAIQKRRLEGSGTTSLVEICVIQVLATLLALQNANRFFNLKQLTYQHWSFPPHLPEASGLPRPRHACTCSM